MKESKVVLHKYATDMLGVEKHFSEILDWQVSDTRLKEYSDADALVRKIRETLRGHIDMLERYIGSLGASETESKFKKAITKISGMTTGFYNLMRQEDSVMRNMRDNYTALNMTAISYTMLHTTALAHRDSELASIALQHLKQITPLVVEVSRIIPQLVVHELHAQDKALDTSVAHEAISNTQRAWERDVLG
jgi:hypothetical protein